MASQNPLKFLKKTFGNLYFLMFLNGFLIASLFYFKMEAAYENGLFLSIKTSIDSKIDANDTQDSIVLKAMNACNMLMTDRSATFQNGTRLGPQSDFFHPASVDLMTAEGACGSYSEVLARILQTYDYPIRIAQMKANGVFAAHNLVEVKTIHGWVVLDPTFNVSFTRPDSRLASFDDVQHNWTFYSKQVPPGYDLTYRYEDVRYSNWTKVPVVFPAIKGMLNLLLGAKRADTISIRTYFLRIYTIYFYIALFLCIPVILFTVKKIVKTKLFPNQNIPLTFSNFVKYLRPRFPNRIQSL
jgi:hypothetical protein